MKSLLDVLSTPEVLESEHAEATLHSLMHMQSRTGVIYATTRAKAYGFKGAGDPSFGNLGQGAPETSEIPGQPHRNLTVVVDEETCEYADVLGRRDLREAVANYYNRMYRQDCISQYTPDNVAIVPGGRAGISRLMATLSDLSLGYFTPEYTAYTQLLAEFAGVSSVALAHDEGDFTSPAHLRASVRQHGLGAIMFSNPCNPTGCIVEGWLLKQYVDIAREESCLMINDEVSGPGWRGAKRSSEAAKRGDEAARLTQILRLLTPPLPVLFALRLRQGTTRRETTYPVPYVFSGQIRQGRRHRSRHNHKRSY